MAKKWFTRRRVGVALVSSGVMHAVLIAGARHERAAPAPFAASDGAGQIAFEPLAPIRAPRVVIVGPRPSGRGRALAGSDPQHKGSPRPAPRTQWARGVARGPGGGGQALEEARALPADEPPPPVVAPPATDDAAALPVPAAAPDDTPSRSPGPPSLPSVDADRAFAELARAQRLRLARENGGGLAGRGPGGGGAGIGLAVDVSGRRVENSPVDSPPVILEERQVECSLPPVLRLQSVVRLLVTRDGAGVLPRLLQSSGHPGFDACALAYVGAMRFAAGIDAAGHPLNVWIHVRVAPTTAGRLGAARW